MSPTLRRLAFALFASTAVPIAAAQTAPAASAPSERAQRDADRVRQMILLHADKPRRTRTDERPAAPAVAARPAVPTAAATPAVNALVAEPAAPVAPSMPELARTPTVAVAPLALHSVTPMATRPTKLELLSGAEPVFPRRLAQTATSGSIRVAFDVLPDGSVTAVQVLRSPHPGLNAAAVAAVSQWRFKPIAERANGVTEFSFE